MKPAHFRYVRQMQVLGESAQEAFAAGNASVPGDDLAAAVAALYLAGSGVGRLSLSSERVAAAVRAHNPSIEVGVPRSLPSPSVYGSELPPLRHPSAAALANGALLALDALRSLAPPKA